MWAIIVCAALWTGITLGWLIPVIRKRIAHEIFAAFGVGGFFTLLILSLSGIWATWDISALRIIGFILNAVGLSFVIFAFLHLRYHGKPTDAWEQTTVVIRKGVYGIVRHPLYFGTAVCTLGVIFAHLSIASGILGAVCIVCLFLASKMEDSYNIEKFGDEYRQYMKDVPLFHPFGRLITKREVT
jgi:protein-S-isoprenylcysteine O-methyltransferase Ste14